MPPSSPFNETYAPVSYLVDLEALAAPDLVLCPHLARPAFAGHLVLDGGLERGLRAVRPPVRRGTCPDHEIRGQKCKPIFAVEQTISRETKLDGSAILYRRLIGAANREPVVPLV